MACFNDTDTCKSVGKSSNPNGPLCVIFAFVIIRFPNVAIGFFGLPIVTCQRPTLAPVSNESKAYNDGRPNLFFIEPIIACPRFISAVFLAVICAAEPILFTTSPIVILPDKRSLTDCKALFAILPTSNPAPLAISRRAPLNWVNAPAMVSVFEPSR